MVASRLASNIIFSNKEHDARSLAPDSGRTFSGGIPDALLINSRGASNRSDADTQLSQG
jgi:hypothetical protein